MYYGVDPSLVAGAAAGTEAHRQTQQKEHQTTVGFLGMDWKSMFAAVLIGSLTAIFTNAVVESVRERKKKLGGKVPPQQALSLTLPVDRDQ